MRQSFSLMLIATTLVFVACQETSQPLGPEPPPLNSTSALTPAVNQPPVADANGPYTGTMGLPVTFDGSGSSDPDGTIISYDWDFGDGGTGTGVAPTHSYAASGLYTVALTVTDEAGDTDTATTTANIINAAVIDIKPGSGPNCLKDSSKGRVVVAILATPSFDVALVDPSSVQIGGVFAVRWSLKKDVSGDGYVDLVLHFKTKDLMAAGLLYDGATWVLTGMMGTGSGALPFSGWDVIYLAGGLNCD
jgi:PKD repeat protein